MPKGQSPFDKTNPIYKNRDVLGSNHVPEEFISRDEQISEYSNLLEPILHGWETDNAFLYGKTGTGKSASTKYMIEWLEEEVPDETDLSTIRLNCERMSTSYQVGVKLVNKLRDSDNCIPETGHPAPKVYDMMFDELNKLGDQIIVVLDEIDKLANGEDTILYELSRAEENDQIDEGKHITVIGITNNMQYRDNISAKTKDSLCEREIIFPAYDANELRIILEQRAEEALKPGVLTDEAIPLAAAYGAQSKGSAREALDILRGAADEAKKRGDDMIGEDHVEYGRKVVERGKVEDLISGLSPQIIYVLQAVLVAEKRDEAPIETKDLYDIYKEVVQEECGDHYSLRSVRDYLSELDLSGLVNSKLHNAGKGGGRYRAHTLDWEVEVVENALFTVEDFSVNEVNTEATKQSQLGE